MAQGRVPFPKLYSPGTRNGPPRQMAITSTKRYRTVSAARAKAVVKKTKDNDLEMIYIYNNVFKLLLCFD